MHRLPMFVVVLAVGSAVAQERAVDFRRDVHPILSKHCFACHAGAGASSGHRLDLRAEILGETNGRPLAVAGKASESVLIRMVSGLGKKVMPPKGPRLSAEQITVLRAWIDQGVAWDEALLPSLAGRPDHWSFRPVVRPPVPTVAGANARTPVDAFLAAKHRELGLTPVAEADRRTLIRRVSLDLLGLPPTPEEVDAFVADDSPDAWQRLTERLLASPHYGERWGRHWLDLARWAESEGYESNHTRPFAWRYRDWVVDAFNRDLPYDRFLRAQLAGDEMVPATDANLIATGFLAAARLSSNEEDKPLQRNDLLVDMVNAVGSTVLGLTLHCAQCHNHKFDPISARDYYRFQGFFIRGQPDNLELRDPELWKVYEAARPPEYEPALKLQQALFERGRRNRIAEAKSKLSADHLAAIEVPADRRTERQRELAREADLAFQFTPQGIEKGIPEADRKLYDELKKKVAELEKNLPARPQTWAFHSPADSGNTFVVLPMKGFYPLVFDRETLSRAKPALLVQGDVHRPGMALDTGWPAVFGPTGDSVKRGPRTALVDWLTARNHPLTARVWVNRIWQFHFGRGLVASSSDFGLKGDAPSNPQLLDWLAAELMDSGWSTRHIHRLILNSQAYRRGSATHAASARVDPDNVHLWRRTPRRLEAEALRDAWLATTGELDRSVGGPSAGEGDEGTLRRALYLFQKRDKPPAATALFDGPNQVTESCARRNCSTVPLQALYLLNNEFSLQRGRALAERVKARAGDDRGRRIEAAFRFVLLRAPTPADRASVERYFSTFSLEPASAETALVHLCQALLNTNEFAYIE